MLCNCCQKEYTPLRGRSYGEYEEGCDKKESLKVVTRKFIAEFTGTFVFLLVGLCATTSSVVSGAQSGIWQSAVVWGIAVTLSIYAVGNISGAHFNPAVSLTMAIMKPSTEFTWLQFIYYSVAQILGGIVAAAVNYAMWSNLIHDFESKNAIDRGTRGSELTAMSFCCFFPNASLYSPEDSGHLMTSFGACLIEIVATALLLFFIFTVSDPHNSSALPAPGPVLIGASVAAIISAIGPLTQAGLNPARDFGPRVVAWITGWGDIAFPGPKYGFWVYIVGPSIGGPIGAMLYTYVLNAHQSNHTRTGRVSLDHSHVKFQSSDEGDNYQSDEHGELLIKKNADKYFKS